MADNTLTTTTNSGSQGGSSNNLQASVPANGISGGTPATIQPGTSNNVLLSTGGIPLGQSSLPTVTLGSTNTQVAVAAPASPHKINAGLLGFSIALFVLAIVLFWYMGRAEKNTTIR